MKELRLVLNGGVFLAVYMNGIVTALWSVSRDLRSCSNTCGPALGGTSKISRGLVQVLETLTGGDSLRIAVDAVTGTSAGGFNGAALARAAVDGADASVLNRVWIEDADIATLRCDPKPVPQTARFLVGLRSSAKPLATLRKSVDHLPGLSWAWLRDIAFALITIKDGRAMPLNSRYFTQVFAKLFKSMRTTGEGVALLPHRGTIDFFLTRTDLDGWPRHLPVACDFHPNSVFERAQVHVMTFRQRPGRRSIGDDFDLTFDLRTTAGFPGAFGRGHFLKARPGHSCRNRVLSSVDRVSACRDGTNDLIFKPRRLVPKITKP